ACIALRGVACPLLVANEDVFDFFLLEKLIIDRQDRSARIAEYMLDAIVPERLNYHFSARHLLPAHFQPLSRRRLCFHYSDPVFDPLSFAINLFRPIKKAPEGALFSHMSRFRPAATPPCPCAILLRE